MALSLAFTEAPGATRDMSDLASATGKRSPSSRRRRPREGRSFPLTGDGWRMSPTSRDGREIYVQPYPGPGGKWQVSTERGQEPVWNQNGGSCSIEAATE